MSQFAISVLDLNIITDTLQASLAFADAQGIYFKYPHEVRKELFTKMIQHLSEMKISVGLEDTQ